MLKRFLKFMFADQSDFSGDPYGLFMNQWGHALASIIVPFISAVIWMELSGELPHRVTTAGVYFGAYVAFEVIKCKICDSRLWIDSAADSAFSTMGLSVAIFGMGDGTMTTMNFDEPVLAEIFACYTIAAGIAAYDEYRRTVA